MISWATYHADVLRDGEGALLRCCRHYFWKWSCRKVRAISSSPNELVTTVVLSSSLAADSCDPVTVPGRSRPACVVAPLRRIPESSLRCPSGHHRCLVRDPGLPSSRHCFHCSRALARSAASRTGSRGLPGIPLSPHIPATHNTRKLLIPFYLISQSKIGDRCHFLHYLQILAIVWETLVPQGWS